MERLFYVCVFVFFLALAFWQISLLLMYKRGGIRKNYGVIIDFILRMDSRLRVVHKSRFSVVIAFSDEEKENWKGMHINSGGGKFDMPFFEILQQYDFLVINYCYLTAEGTKGKKNLTFKDTEDQRTICEMLASEVRNIVTNREIAQTRMSWEKRIKEEEAENEKRAAKATDGVDNATDGVDKAD